MSKEDLEGRRDELVAALIIETEKAHDLWLTSQFGSMEDDAAYNESEARVDILEKELVLVLRALDYAGRAKAQQAFERLTELATSSGAKLFLAEELPDEPPKPRSRRSPTH